MKSRRSERQRACTRQRPPALLSENGWYIETSRNVRAQPGGAPAREVPRLVEVVEDLVEYDRVHRAGRGPPGDVAHEEARADSSVCVPRRRDRGGAEVDAGEADQRPRRQMPGEQPLAASEVDHAAGPYEHGGERRVTRRLSSRAATFVDAVYQRADAFLFGRVTYEIFAGYWGVMADSANPIAAALNTRPKYVASTTLTDPHWADTTVLSGDVAAAVGELKAKPGGELQVHGSGNLARWLLDNQLVDEITLLTYPLVVGQGTRLFPATGPDKALELLESRATPGGLIIQVYRPTGRPQYAT